MVIRSQERQNPAYRATLLPIRWAQVKTALTFLHFRCTSCYITCRRFKCFYGESMGKYGQFYGQISTTNNFVKLFAFHLIVEAYRATLLLFCVRRPSNHSAGPFENLVSQNLEINKRENQTRIAIRNELKNSIFWNRPRPQGP